MAIGGCEGRGRMVKVITGSGRIAGLRYLPNQPLQQDRMSRAQAATNGGSDTGVSAPGLHEALRWNGSTWPTG
jgi:hypothetical protein